jgi:excinuclease ABC subunit A
LEIIRKLQQQGNTVVVVEHDELFMKHADYIIDLGPYAGIRGGEIVFQGPTSEFAQVPQTQSITQAYFKNPHAIPIFPRKYAKKPPPAFIEVTNAYQHNLKNLCLKIPVHRITVIAGVSGSGKSTLAHDVIYQSIRNLLFHHYNDEDVSDRLHSGCERIQFPSEWITNVEYLDQRALNRSSRSNAVTYIGVWDMIRKLYASLPEAKELELTSSHFSFNSPGGRCEVCEGLGTITIEMQFLSDIQIVCEACKGKRFQERILKVKYKGHSVSDILELTVDEAYDLFQDQEGIRSGLEILKEVGLGYLRLGQETTTLSGGEAQRLKIASYLSTENEGPTLFIFDEPTTGLHLYDVEIFLKAVLKLIEKGHTVLIIEHHPDVIKNADYLLELGPGSGKDGGYLIFAGHPKDLIHKTDSPTAPFMKPKFQ